MYGLPAVARSYCKIRCHAQLHVFQVSPHCDFSSCRFPLCVLRWLPFIGFDSVFFLKHGIVYFIWDVKVNDGLARFECPVSFLSSFKKMFRNWFAIWVIGVKDNPQPISHSNLVNMQRKVVRPSIPPGNYSVIECFFQSRCSDTNWYVIHSFNEILVLFI